MKFSFGNSEFERIEVEVQNYEQRQPTGDGWDDNWLVVEIRVSAGGFRGKVSATIMSGEVTAFLSKLRPLYEKLKGAAEFKTMEGQLSLKLVGDGKGHIELCGELLDKAGIANRLNFILHFDQTQLHQSILQLEKVVSQFPVR